MSHPSNGLTVETSSQISAAAPSGPAVSSSTPRAQLLKNVIVYSYASQSVIVGLAETYEYAVDIAKESFQELKDIERERISFKAAVEPPNTKVVPVVVIGRTAWPIAAALVRRYAVVVICVAPPVASETAEALSSSQASPIEPPPYAPEKSGYSNLQTNVVAPYGPQTPSSQLPSQSSLVTRVVKLLTPNALTVEPRAQLLANVILYSYASRLVLVGLAETYDYAVDIAKESFQELRDFERGRISFKTVVKRRNTEEHQEMVVIGHTAWPIVASLLPQLETVEIHVAPTVAPETATVGPPAYAQEKSGSSNPQTNVAPQTPSSQSPSQPSLVTRVVNLLTPKSSRSRLFP